MEGGPAAAASAVESLLRAPEAATNVREQGKEKDGEEGSEFG